MGLPTLKRWGKRRVTGASGSVSPVAASVWVKAELTVEVESGEAVEMTGAAMPVLCRHAIAGDRINPRSKLAEHIRARAGMGSVQRTDGSERGHRVVLCPVRHNRGCRASGVHLCNAV